jgi:hypothetical protein
MRGLIGRATTHLQDSVLAAKSNLKSEVDDAASRLNAHIANVATKGAAWVAAAILFAIGIGFATFAGYQALLRSFLPEQAAAIIAGVYFVLALIGISAAATIGKPGPRKATEPAREVATPSKGLLSVVESRQPAPGEAINTALAHSHPPEIMRVANLLGAVGRTNEQAALLIASEAAKSLSPLQLVAAGLVAGFVFGRKLDLPRRETGKGA